jgi:hypothetical protein
VRHGGLFSFFDVTTSHGLVKVKSKRKPKWPGRNLAGQRFGKLRVTKRWIGLKVGRKGRVDPATFWHVHCDCGTKKIVRGSDMRRSGGSNATSTWYPVRSCGCLARASGSESRSYKHGGIGRNAEFRREYNSWAAMNQRCYDENNISYENYHGKGITVCDRWRSDLLKGEGFKNFLLDMGRRPEGMTLDRKNVLLGYTPDNCQWATPLEQTYNRACMKTPEELAELQRLADEQRALKKKSILSSALTC